jgi:hypothetical protein
MLEDILTLFKILKYQKEIKRVFFFENNFIEHHLAPYTKKNKNTSETIIVSLYNIKNSDLKKFKIFKFKKLFFLNLFFLLLKIKYCYSSTPDFDNSAFQRSVFKKTKYIYIQHSPLGLIKIYRDNAFSNFDVVQVVNSFQKNDLINISKIKNKKIKSWRGKYLFLNNQNDKKMQTNINREQKKKILIAPTWGTDFFDLNFHLEIQKNLDHNLFDIYIRPHFMSIKKNKNLINELTEKNFQISSGKINFSQFDLLITDWSGIYIEFAKINKVKSILIQNNEKVLNEKFNEFKNKSIDTYARQKLGKILTTKEVDSIQSVVDDIFMNEINYVNEINKFFEEYFY